MQTEGELRPFVVGESYKVTYNRERKSWDKKSRPDTKATFMGVYKGISADGERFVFVNKTTSYGVRPEKLVKWEHLDWVKRNVEA
jgi:hypothetical protein